jgi:hypothetical protein
MLCALVLAVTSWGSDSATSVAPQRVQTVPGFPATSLADDDGPWQRAWADAVELGAYADVFWDQIAATGLLVPTAWLGASGWPALWARANQAGRCG